MWGDTGWGGVGVTMEGSVGTPSTAGTVGAPFTPSHEGVFYVLIGIAYIGAAVLLFFFLNNRGLLPPTWRGGPTPTHSGQGPPGS